MVEAKEGAVKQKNSMWGALKPWIRDLIEVVVEVGVIIVVLKLLLGARMILPLVAVTTGSMVHEPGDDMWKTWMTSRGIAINQVNGFPLQGGFNVGDMIVVKSPDANLGEVLIYERDKDHSMGGDIPIIHRAVGIAYVEDWEVARTEGTLDCFTNDTITKYVDVIRNCASIGSKNCPYPSIPKSSSFRLYITKGDHNIESDQCSKVMQISYPVNEEQVLGRGFFRIPYIGYLKIIPTMIFRLLLGL